MDARARTLALLASPGRMAPLDAGLRRELAAPAVQDRRAREAALVREAAEAGDPRVVAAVLGRVAVPAEAEVETWAEVDARMAGMLEEHPHLAEAVSG